MRVDSEIKKFSGHVVLPDFMNILQVRAFEDAYFGDVNEAKEDGKRVFLSVSDEKMLAFLLGFVSEWHLENVPEKPTQETFPQTPRGKAHELIKKLSAKCLELYAGEIEVPNA